jgi:hypothetical protein
MCIYIIDLLIIFKKYVMLHYYSNFLKHNDDLSKLLLSNI